LPLIDELVITLKKFFYIINLRFTIDSFDIFGHMKL